MNIFDYELKTFWHYKYYIAIAAIQQLIILIYTLYQ